MFKDFRKQKYVLPTFTQFELVVVIYIIIIFN